MKPNPPVLRTPAAAAYLALSESTLEKYRVTGQGPIYHKAGPKIVIYRSEDLDEWLNARRRRSTSETGATTLEPTGRSN
jgi:predicted DNA-binding transcriptional regulator AlpA